MIFGVLMVVTAISALIGDLFILPAILLRIELVTLWDFVSETMGKGLWQRIALLGDVLSSRVTSLVVIGFEQNFRSRDVIFGWGDRRKTLYLILRGKVLVSVNKDGREEAIGEFGKGHILGEMAWNRAFWLQTKVTALEPCRLLQINRHTLDRRVKNLLLYTASTPCLKLDGIPAKRQETDRGALNCRCLPGKATIYSFWLRIQPEE
jgi:hypothetical protein